MIGGTEAGAGNLISGVVIDRSVGPDPDGNRIQGNIIGLNARGDARVSNQSYGIALHSGKETTIGGTSPAARNVVSGNVADGIFLNSSVTGIQIQGNYIGTDAAGSQAIGNGDVNTPFSEEAIHIQGPKNIVGGSVPGARNVISGNRGSGIVVASQGENQILGNYIGVSASGASALGNGWDGIIVSNSARNVIGGATAGAGNVISGNRRNGVDMGGNESTGNRLQGNLIGTDATGTQSLGNSEVGVNLGGNNNTLGGLTPAERNVISGNTLDGVIISGVFGNQRNRIIGNYIGTDIRGIGALGNGGSGVLLITEEQFVSGARKPAQATPSRSTAVTASGSTPDRVTPLYPILSSPTRNWELNWEPTPGLIWATV
ncbi:MAG: hypothetical protein HY644_15300 [Acidobacteria bacterium]|nr:hypothetical protein [Acidobacteriota bacterium]